MREIVFDTETTGLSPAGGDRMVEIGCVEMFNRVETGRTFHSYFNPGRPMPSEAEAVHGLSNRFLSDKPNFHDRCEELGVDQRAMLDADTAVDAETGAQGVEAVLGAGMPLAREHQGVDHALHADGVAPAALELEIQKAEIEARIMRDEGRILDEVEQLLDALREVGLVRQEQVAETVDLLRLERHVALGVEVSVEMPPRLDAVEDLHAADLDHPVAAGRVQPRGLGIEDDLTHS